MTVIANGMWPTIDDRLGAGEELSAILETAGWPAAENMSTIAPRGHERVAIRWCIDGSTLVATIGREFILLGVAGAPTLGISFDVEHAASTLQRLALPPGWESPERRESRISENPQAATPGDVRFLLDLVKQMRMELSVARSWRDSPDACNAASGEAPFDWIGAKAGPFVPPA